MFTDQSFITALAPKSFVHFDYPACFWLLWSAAAALMWWWEAGGGGGGCSDSRRHTVNLMNGPCNTSTLHHGVQQKSRRGWPFSPTSRVKLRLDDPSWCGGRNLHHSPVSPLNLHLSDSHPFALASHSAGHSPSLVRPSTRPLILAHRFYLPSPPLPHSHFHFSSCRGDHLLLLKWGENTIKSKRLKKIIKNGSSCRGKETHLHAQAQLTDVCKRSRSGSGGCAENVGGEENLVFPLNVSLLPGRHGVYCFTVNY